MTARPCPLVLIEWWDSAQPRAAWQHLADLDPPHAVRCVSVGWLVTDTPDTKALAPNMGDIHDPEQAQVSGLITIPTRSIIKITKLREPRVRTSP